MTESFKLPIGVEIDWPDLLRRYIDHVGYCEGTTFLSDSWQRELIERFNQNEINVLRKLDP